MVLHVYLFTLRRKDDEKCCGEEKIKSERTIQSQVLKGYLILTAVMVFLVWLSITFLWTAQIEGNRIIGYQEERYEAQKVISAHYQWLEQLSDAITTGSEFTDSPDPDRCALGNWLADSGSRLNKDSVMNKAVNQLIEPHREIHLTAGEVIELSKSDREAAYQIYGSDFKPKVKEIGENLTIIIDRYQETIERLNKRSHFLTILSNILLIGIGLFDILFSIRTGKRLSKRIAEPIIAADQWLAQLSTGVDNLELKESDLNIEEMPREIGSMMDSFKKMRDCLEANVSVIKKVAEGDLTAYVDIRSDGDALGRNLYHLVQNNDFMFANLLHVADSVAGNAEQIALASQSLAEGPPCRRRL